MAQLSREEFEALWEDAQRAPAIREAVVRPIQIDLSLSGVLDRYMTMAGGFLAQGKINKVDHDALVAAITALKAILSRFNEKDLVAQEMADRAKLIEQRMQERITNLVGALRR
jgi:hypothetical protein